jgi:hypothetical protein
VHAWRLRRQLLAPRATSDVAEIAGRLCGIQAQVASAAALAIQVRQARPRPGEVERALVDGAVVKTWAMRGTLHLLRVSDAGCFLSVMASGRTWERAPWQRAFGASPKEVAALAGAVAELLDGVALTRGELVARIARRKGLAKLAEPLRSGWGMLLKPLAWQGILVHGPKRGNETTFTTPQKVSPAWRALPAPEDAAPVVLRAYLGAYGPATLDAFDAWLGRGAVKRTVLRAWLAGMGDEVTTVEVEGRTAYLLAAHADELARTRASKVVRLLGGFDQWVLGPGTSDPEVVAAAHRAHVSKAAGWIAPIVLSAGRIVGVWELAGERVKVTLFRAAARPDLGALEAEVAHLAQATGRAGLVLDLR